MEAFKNSANFDAVVSPPFPLEDNAKSCALLIGNGATLNEAMCAIEEAKKNYATLSVEENSLVDVLGYDVGGANTKAAYLQGQRRQMYQCKSCS